MFPVVKKEFIQLECARLCASKSSAESLEK